MGTGTHTRSKKVRCSRWDAKRKEKPKPYNNYVALLCDIIDKEPSTYEEALEKKEWKDAMIEEYWSIMKN